MMNLLLLLLLLAGSRHGTGNSLPPDICPWLGVGVDWECEFYASFQTS